MKLELTCKYCNYKVIKDYYSKSFATGDKCDRCGDSHLIIKDLEKSKIDQYKDSPAFSDTEKEKDDYEDYL